VDGSRPALGVVIVSFNTCTLLDRCLTSLGAEVARLGLSSETWVVDNASTDGSAEMVVAHHPWVRVEALASNLGFAAGNNRVLQRWLDEPAARPTWCLLLNPDTELRPGALEALIGALEPDVAAAVAGPALVYPDGRFQHGAFRFPGLAQTALDLFPIARLMDTRVNGRYPRQRYARGRAFAVDFTLGACMLVRAYAMARVGPLDEGFFMYCEEVDWARRFRDAGYRTLCVPSAVVVHHAGASTAQIRDAMFTALWRSRLRYFAKHASPARRALLVAVVRTGLVGQTLLDRYAVARGHLTAADRARRAAAYRAVLAGPPP
jgi:N-acetylglucosaminyl-diphospho-decaprenol L-rhamnosyltransferase